MNSKARCNNCKEYFPKDLIKKMGGSQFCSDDCIQAKQEKMQEKAKNTKGINKVSKKKQKRIREGGGEKELFLEIWNEREHNCDSCGRYLPGLKTWTCSHIVSKGADCTKRLDKNNILLECFACHFKRDHGLNHKGPDLDI